jgi:dephospho-CoA kinase
MMLLVTGAGAAGKSTVRRLMSPAEAAAEVVDWCRSVIAGG